MNLIQHSFKTITLGLGLTALTLSAWSQPAGRPGAMGRPGTTRGMSQAVKDLNLTPQQQARIQKVAENARAQHRAILANTKLNDQQKRAKIMQNMKTMRASLDAILTPAQRQKVAAIRQQRMKAMHGMRPAPKARG